MKNAKNKQEIIKHNKTVTTEDIKEYLNEYVKNVIIRLGKIIDEEKEFEYINSPETQPPNPKRPIEFEINSGCILHINEHRLQVEKPIPKIITDNAHKLYSVKRIFGKLKISVKTQRLKNAIDKKELDVKDKRSGYDFINFTVDSKKIMIAYSDNQGIVYHHDDLDKLIECNDDNFYDIFRFNEEIYPSQNKG
ncbi:MAG: hypothetical protein AB8E82_11320 [Aureispira sp.]